MSFVGSYSKNGPFICSSHNYHCGLLKVIKRNNNFLGTYLHSDFRQVDLQGQLLSAVHVRVVGFLEGPLQLVQLEGGERGPVPAVLLLVALVVGQFSAGVR